MIASTIDVRSPYDQELLATIPLTTRDQALNVVMRMTEYQKRQKEFPLAERYKALEQFARLMEAERDRIIHQSILEGGKPLVDTSIEMDRAIFGVKETLGCLTKLAGQQIPMGLSANSAGRIAFTERTAYGLVFAISAFNHPINLFIHQVVPALALGAPVIYKPATETPLSSKFLTELLYRSGFSEQDLSWLVCTNETAEALVACHQVRVLSFIGSASVGWKLRAKAHPGCRVILEHGGTAPAIIAPDFDPAAAIPSLTKGAYYHAGQVCISVQHIYVPESKVTAFVAGFSQKASSLRVGDPLLATTEVGPIIRQRDLDRIDSWVHEARESGGHLVCGGAKLDGQCYAPTVILNPSKQCRLAREEVFGPVAVVFGYSDLNRTVTDINDSPFGFQAALYTNALETAWRVGRELQTAAVIINDHTAFRVDWMPFQGIKQSGLGQGGIMYTLEEYSYNKLWVFKS